MKPQIELMKIALPTIRIDAAFLTLTICFCLLFINTTYGQTQKPSVQTGVTFQWSDTQTVASDPATIQSVTIDGLVYESFAAPTSYAMTRLGPNGHSANKIIQNGTIVNNSSANATWPVDALASYQDKNLNHYFLSNSNGRNICNNFTAVATTDAQLQTLSYNPGIPSNAGGLLAFTERNANNCYYIAVHGTPVGGGPEQFLGDTFVRANTTQWGALFNPPPANVDYWNAGRMIENGGTVGIAIFKLNDLAPTGSIITKVELLAATTDHADGKAFIIQKYATPIYDKACLDRENNGTVANYGTIPAGSTFTLVSGPTPPGRSFTFNPDGSYTYVPSREFLGVMEFEYQVCLPAPNASTCDTSIVNITYVPWTDPSCSCSEGEGNADGPSLQN